MRLKMTYGNCGHFSLDHNVLTSIGPYQYKDAASRHNECLLWMYGDPKSNNIISHTVNIPYLHLNEPPAKLLLITLYADGLYINVIEIIRPHI